MASKLDSLQPELREEILQHLAVNGPTPTTKAYASVLGWNEKNFYRTLLRQYKKIQKKQEERLKTNLDYEAKDLVDKFRAGEVGFDEVHTEIGARALEQILSGSGNIKMQDFLRATTVKMKKDQSEKAKDAMEDFIDGLFSGFVSSPVCPHCGRETVISKEQHAKQYKRKNR